MKIHLFVLCCIVCSSMGTFAQEKTRFGQKVAQTATADACGDLNLNMAVKLSREHEIAAQPEPDKAKIYFIQDSGMWGRPTTKIGIDGKWVGANKKESHFSITVDPGVHHLCVTIQSSLSRHRDVELTHLKEPHLY